MVVHICFMRAIKSHLLDIIRTEIAMGLENVLCCKSRRDRPPGFSGAIPTYHPAKLSLYYLLFPLS